METREYKVLQKKLKIQDEAFRDMESQSKKYGTGNVVALFRSDPIELTCTILEERSTRNMYDLYNNFCNRMTRSER